MQIEAKKKLGRPPDPAKVEAVLDAGWTLFLAKGFEAVSMEAIAHASGVSRVTVYKHFPDKAALFATAVLRATKRIEAEQQQAGAAPDGPLAERLERFGIALMSFLGSPTAISFYSVLSGELRHHPDVAKTFYELGPARTIANLATLLSEAQVSGEIMIADAERAAEMLIGMWQGMSNYRLALAIDTDGYHAALAENVRAGVALFLRGVQAELPTTGDRVAP